MFSFSSVRHTIYLLGAAATLVLATATASHAVAIMSDTANSESGLGTWTGDFAYTPTSSTTAQMVISLTNTSPMANGGFITAFVFNNPGLKLGGGTISFTDTDFGAAIASNFFNGAPFGKFDILTSTSCCAANGFEGGGMPQLGIGVGVTETFTYNWTGTMLDTLSEQDFFNELSDGSMGAGQGTKAFAVRFRGFLDGGSDKVPGIPGMPGDPNGGNPVPEPSTIALFGSGLLGMVLWRARKNKKELSA